MEYWPISDIIVARAQFVGGKGGIFPLHCWPPDLKSRLALPRSPQMSLLVFPIAFTYKSRLDCCTCRLYEYLIVVINVFGFLIIIVMIKGKNMELGAQLVDYAVLIGTSARCVGKELTDNVLQCQPPAEEPPIDINSNNWCAAKKLNPVVVGLCTVKLKYIKIRGRKQHVKYGDAMYYTSSTAFPFPSPPFFEFYICFLFYISIRA